RGGVVGLLLEVGQEPGLAVLGVKTSAFISLVVDAAADAADVEQVLGSPLRPLPLNVPVVPPLLSVMVSVSVAPVLGSLIVTPANGCTGASDVVVCPATVPLMVGAPAGSVLITATTGPVSSGAVTLTLAP